MRRLTELAVLAVRVLRAWLEGQAERRFTLATVSAEAWVDDAQLERVLQVVQLRVRLRPDVPPADQMAEAWNAHDLLPSVGQARVEVEAGRRTLVLVGADLRAADLRSANFAGADIRGANLAGAFLANAEMTGTRR
mgnify:CR=1 FL=1